MSKRKHVGLWIVLGLVALLVLLPVGAQVAVNTRYVKDRINKVLNGSVDGRLYYDRLDISFIKSFPTLRVTLDTVSLTYDHDKFAQWDGAGAPDVLLSAGRGETMDTLARFDRFTAAVNLWELVTGRLRLKDAHISNPGAFVHFYDSTASNLGILHFESDGKEKDTTKVFTTPPVSIGEVYVENMRAVYTDQSSNIFGEALMDRISVSGFIRFAEDGSLKARKIALDIDSLDADARIPSNSATVSLDRLRISEPARNVFDILVNLYAEASTKDYGALRLPVDLDCRVGLDKPAGSIAGIDVPHLDGRIACIPLHADGNAVIYSDSTALDARLTITDCPLDTLIEEYAVKFTDFAKQVRTDARFTLDADASGILADGKLPAVKASLQIPASRVAYAPLGVDGSLELDVDGSMSPEKVIDATVNALKAKLPGIDLKVDGKGKDILGRDPSFDAEADFSGSLASVSTFLPASLGLKADGNVDMHAEAEGRMSYFKNLNFDKGKFLATLTGDRITVRMPKDTLDIRLTRPDIKATIDSHGLDATADSRSVSFKKGAGLSAMVMNMSNHAVMKNEESHGQMLPLADVDHNSRSLSLRLGNNWFRVRDVDLCAAVRKNPDMSALRGRMRGQARPEGTRNRMRTGTRSRDDGFDLDISLDTAITRYLRDWTPSFDLHIGRGSAAMPVLPLRTSLAGIQASYDGNVLQVDSLSAQMGSSRLAARGKVSGLRRALMRKGRIDTDFYFHSRRVNVNELVAAFNHAAENNAADTMYAEGDESFIVDSLENATLEKSGIPLIMMPSNVTASVKVLVDEVDYSDYVIRPLETNITLKDRTLQLMDTKVSTDLGNIGLNAFYSTPDKRNISAGVDLGVYEVSADSLIRLIPSVDALMPALKSFKGKLNCEASALTQLDTSMNVVIPSLEGVVRINGKDLNVDDAGGLKKITRLLRFKNPDIGRIDDLDVNAVIHDSKVDVFPFQLGVDRYRLALHGMQGLDKTMYYHASVLKSPFLLRFGINVFGSFDKWSFNIGLPKYKSGNIPVFTKQIDTMQVNIANTIRDIYENGINDVVSHNVGRSLRDRQREVGYEGASAEMTLDEAVSAEQLAFELDAMIEEEALIAEVDAVLEESFRDIEAVMKDYESQVYDDRIFRKMDRLAKKQARKEAKKKDD